MESLLEDWEALRTCNPPVNACINAWVLLALVSSPHFLYAFIWYRPALWMRAFGGKAVDVFALCGALGKGIQFAAVLLWWACNRAEGPCLDLSSISLLNWLAALAMVAYGQSLNLGIFSAIGHDGVYYGFKLGRKVPWVSCWPFDTVSHPQYVGSVLTVWGMAALVWVQAPPGLGVLVAFWTGLYVVTGVQEDKL